MTDYESMSDTELHKHLGGILLEYVRRHGTGKPNTTRVFAEVFSGMKSLQFVITTSITQSPSIIAQSIGPGDEEGELVVEELFNLCEVYVLRLISPHAN